MNENEINQCADMGYRDVISELIDLVNGDEIFTDIHMETDQPVMLKTPAGWKPAPNFDTLYKDDVEQFLAKMDEDWRTVLEHGALSKAFDLSACRLRINAYRINGSTRHAIAIRRQPLSPLSIGETGLPMYVRPVLKNAKGLIIVAGQTGSGKTTTLASMVDNINEEQAAHIITIEDPIEYVHNRKKSIISHKQVPTDVQSFSVGLRDALRQKPDVILVGEIRDRETADVVMMAAESGHLVLCSLHTNSAAGAVTKLLSFFPADEIVQRCRTLSDSLLMVICQNLVASADEKSFVLASEIFMNTDAQSAAILADQSKHTQIRDLMARSTDKMSRTLNADLKALLMERRISQKDALRVTNDRMELAGIISNLKMQQPR